MFGKLGWFVPVHFPDWAWEKNKFEPNEHSKKELKKKPCRGNLGRYLKNSAQLISFFRKSEYQLFTFVSSPQPGKNVENHFQFLFKTVYWRYFCKNGICILWDLRKTKSLHSNQFYYYKMTMRCQMASTTTLFLAVKLFAIQVLSDAK